MKCLVIEMRQPAGRGRWEFHSAEPWESGKWMAKSYKTTPIQAQRRYLLNWIANEHHYWSTQKVKREYRLREYRATGVVYGG